MRNEQPQGVSKQVKNPAVVDGAIIVDLEIQENNGVALASRLLVSIDDGTTRPEVTVNINPATLRTRNDVIHLNFVSNVEQTFKINIVDVKGEDAYTHSVTVPANGDKHFTLKYLQGSFTLSSTEVVTVEMASTPQ